MSIIRLPGGQRIATASVKRYIVVRLPAPLERKASIVARTDNLDYARQKAASPSPSGLLIFDATTGEPVS